jgi:hypothetical protein
VRLHGDRAELQDRFNVETLPGRIALADWFETEGAGELACVAPPAACPPPLRPPPRSKRHGVNLIGYPRGEFGLGEDIRALALALDAVGIPYSVFELPRGSSARQEDRTLVAQITDARPYEVDILCQNAFDTARCHLDGSLGVRRNYTIGYWPWELARLPPCWRNVYGLVDEVWAASKFTFDAYAADRAGIVRLVPPAVAVDPALAHTRAARVAGSPFTFFCSFDPHSFLARKNPRAALRAFKAAFFPNDTGVRLVLHMNSCAPAPPWLIEAITADPRCQLEAGTLNREAHLRRLMASDCLLSPHRAEGFGRNLAEAVLLGVAVPGKRGANSLVGTDHLRRRIPV